MNQQFPSIAQHHNWYHRRGHALLGHAAQPSEEFEQLFETHKQAEIQLLELSATFKLLHEHIERIAQRYRKVG